MTAIKLSNKVLYEALDIWNKCGRNFSIASRSCGMAKSTFRDRVYAALKIKTMEEWGFAPPVAQWSYPASEAIDVYGGSVLIGGDAHLWSDNFPVMCKAFIALAKKLKPKVIILNGDIIDGARVSRHGRFLGVNYPRVSDEIEAAQAFVKALPVTSQVYWTIGNHDLRVDSYLANIAPELEEYAGRLSDRFPRVTFAYAVQINNVEIRHRFRGGIHASWNNALHSGITMVTNHTHQLSITAVRNRNGTHWGVETGMLGDPTSPAFEYTEGSPSRRQEGFVLLTFDDDGCLMPPEFCEMIRARPVFRGQYLQV